MALVVPPGCLHLCKKPLWTVTLCLECSRDCTGAVLCFFEGTGGHMVIICKLCVILVLS